MRILLIDDDEHARSFLTRALERAGHEVHVAANGRGIRALIGTCQPDVVFTDVFMPEVDGLEALAMLRAAAPELPVVVMSGGSPNLGNCLRMAEMLGAAAILEKPVKVQVLLETLRVATSSHPSSNPPAEVAPS